MLRRWQDGARFEEFMARHAEESRDEMQAIKSLNVFYQVCVTAKIFFLFHLLKKQNSLTTFISTSVQTVNLSIKNVCENFVSVGL